MIFLASGMEIFSLLRALFHHISRRNQNPIIFLRALGMFEILRSTSIFSCQMRTRVADLGTGWKAGKTYPNDSVPLSLETRLPHYPTASHSPHGAITLLPRNTNNGVDSYVGIPSVWVFREPLEIWTRDIGWRTGV